METSVLRVQRLEIIDSRGRPRITLDATGGSDGAEDPYIELFDARRISRLSMMIDSNASDNGGLVSISFDQAAKYDTPRLVLQLCDNEVSIKEIDIETGSEIRRVRWQRVSDRAEVPA
jgi:hypothetical protein